MYINCHTYYSLRYGTISEKELIEIAIRDNAAQVVLSDVNNTSACLNFVRLAQRNNIKAILGIDFRIGAKQLYLGIAKNNIGFQQLNDFLSHHKHNKTEFYEIAPPLEDVLFIYPLEQILLLNKTSFDDNEYIGISRFELSKLVYSEYSKYSNKLVALNSYTFTGKRDYNVHRLLRAIDNNVLLSKLDPEQQAAHTDIYLPTDQLVEHYKNYPHIIENTRQLLDNCRVYFDFGPDRPHQNKLSYTGKRSEDEQLIGDLCLKGLQYRYKEINDDIRRRLHKELTLIKKMDYVPFFFGELGYHQLCTAKGIFSCRAG